MSRTIKIPSNDSDLSKLLEPAVEALRQGGVVVFPTETLYGLAADPNNPEALDRLAALKGRPDGKPIALLASRNDQVKAMVKKVPEAARRLMDLYWPGPLTLILPARDEVDPRLCSADRGVGARVTPHAVASALAEGLGKAITATSANLNGREAPDEIDKIDCSVIKGADFLIDAGATAGGPPSTVLDIRTSPPHILRPGAISLPDWVFT